MFEENYVQQSDYNYNHSMKESFLYLLCQPPRL